MTITPGLEVKISEMAARIRDLREISGFTPAEMAEKTGVSVEEYLTCENGEEDLNFAFIYRCAIAFKVDVTDLIEGFSPKLRGYTVTRKGEGQPVDEAHEMVYYNLAAAFQNRIAEPLLVQAKYAAGAESREIERTTHEGQECDIVIKGHLKVQVGSHTEILGEGDSIYYDSGTPHGMIAVNGEDCLFYAIVLNPTGAPIPELQPKEAPLPVLRDPSPRLWRDYVEPVVDENGVLQSVSFKNREKFNFAFDVIDRLGVENPDQLGMLHISQDHEEKRITFGELKRASSQAANYFKSLGIRRGDRVLLLLKRHYQYWYALLGLHKLGAIAIPAMSQVTARDLEYRFQKAGVSAVLCTAAGDAAHQVELAAEHCPELKTKIIVNGRRKGWHDFDQQYPLFSGRFPRPADAPCGKELMLMYFTSGTTGYPKIAAHNYEYALGQFVAAKYWHCIEAGGLHLTISDTGWAKAAWGKLYGQWMCEGALFVYDFDRFDANDIMPMFAKYQITSFCAPPTMLRMMVKDDLSRFDFSSVKHMSTAGEALNPEVSRQFKKATGLEIMEGFGQTETTLIIGNMRGTELKYGSMGRPNPLYPVDLVDGDGKPVAVGENGEIVIRTGPGESPGLLQEYYNDPAATENAWRNSMYHTGDLAWKDEDGYYWYVGRIDDVIKSSGYRIGPFEIESVIMELPYVLECGVSPAPDEVRGQVVKASIVLTQGTKETEALKKEIQEYVKEHTAPYKYPRIVVFRDELPKTSSGKIMRSKL
ncbi:MAG TPA: AMP-binding protein [Clostridiales bacterium]|nr:AMP-binding protein [Clostridiales bacterium]